METFWKKVHKCKHEPTSNYLKYIYCDTPYCSCHEWHCRKCGVYISECGCGCNNGMSGWSEKRWKNYNKKKYKNYENKK